MKINSHKLGMLTFLVLLMTSLFPVSGLGVFGDVEVEQQDKVLVWAYNSPLGDENTPTHSSSVYGADYMASIYNGLLKRTIASDRAYVPDLAASMPTVSANNTVWTFTLRDGLNFSDGSELNASSIVFSYRISLTTSIDSGAGGLAIYFPTNTSIWEIDRLTVRFNMSIPYAFAPGLFTSWIYSKAHFGPLYDECLADATLAACDWNDVSGVNLAGGSGAFMMDKYDATNNFIEMIPNPFYYNADQIKLDRIVIRQIGDATAAKAAFASGETNVFDSQYKAKAADFANLAGVTDVFVGAPGIQEMVPNHNNQYYGIGNYTTATKTVTDDGGPIDAAAARNIRKAMSHMVDRIFIADEITGGLGSPAATIMPKIAIGWDETILPRIYSQDIAKGYMEDAGFDYTGKTFDASTGAMNDPFFSITVLSPTGNADREQWAAIMVQELPKIGIGVLGHETGGFTTVLYPRTFTNPGPPPSYADGGYDIFFVGWSFGLDFDPVGLYEKEFQNPECCNVYNYDNSTVEDAIAAYVGELDASARLPLVKLVQELLFDDQPSLPIVSTTDHWAWASNILGLDGLSMSQRDFEWELVDINFDIAGVSSIEGTFTTDTETETVTGGEVTVTEDSPVSVMSIFIAITFTAFIAIYRRRN